MTAYYFFTPPLLLDLPSTPLPDPAENPGFYGEIWLRYPLDQQLYPMGVGHNMRAFCGLRAILNDLCAVSFNLSANGRCLIALDNVILA